MFQSLRCPIVVTVLFSTLLWGIAVAAPRVEIAEPVHDAGEVLEGTQISHEFVLRNTGSDLLIFTVKPC